MKRTIYLLLFLISILLFPQCGKHEMTIRKVVPFPTVIIPPFGAYGYNLLSYSYNKNDTITSAHASSLFAELKGSAGLKILLTNLSKDKNAYWQLDSISNWKISKYDTVLNQQILYAAPDSFNDVKMTLTGTSGKLKIDFFYDNASTSSHTNIFTWYKPKK